MQRPHTMMSAAPVPQPHMPLGSPSMRPMQGPMHQQPMMVRPVGSPYGAVNRAMLYDKNKRSAYSNDLRQQPIAPPGQPPPSQMPYGNVMAANQSMMSHSLPSGGMPARQ